MTKKIPGFDNYTINEQGILYNIKRNKQLNPYLINGYLVVKLYNENISKNFKVHRLVCMIYLNIRDTDIIDHRNRIKTDNRLCNLRVVSQLVNCHNISSLSKAKSDIASKYTGIYKKNDIHISSICINGKSYTKRFEDSPRAIQRCLWFRVHKKIEHGVLV